MCQKPILFYLRNFRFGSVLWNKKEIKYDLNSWLDFGKKNNEKYADLNIKIKSMRCPPNRRTHIPDSENIRFYKPVTLSEIEQD